MVNNADQQFQSNLPLETTNQLQSELTPEQLTEQFPGGQSTLPPTLAERARAGVANAGETIQQAAGTAVGGLQQAGQFVGQQGRQLGESVQEAVGISPTRQSELTQAQLEQQQPSLRQSTLTDEQLAASGIPLQSQAPLTGTEGLGTPQTTTQTTGVAGEVQQPQIPRMISDEQAQLSDEEFTNIEEAIKQNFVSGLIGLGKNGQKLDKESAIQLLLGSVERFEGKIPQNQIAGALGDVAKQLQAASDELGFDNFDAMAQAINARFENNTALLNMPSDQLAKELSQGIMTTNDLDDMKRLDPVKYDEVINQLNDIAKNNRRNNNLAGVVEPTVEPAEFNSTNFYEKENRDPELVDRFMDGSENAVDLYNFFVDTDAVKSTEKELILLQDEFRSKEDQLTTLQDDLIEEFGGKLSKGAMNALISDRTQRIRGELDTIADRIDNRVQGMDNMKDSGETLFNVALQERESNWTKQREQANFNFKVDQTQRENSWKQQNFAFDKEQRNFTNTLGLLDKFFINDVSQAQASALVGKWMQKGMDYTIAPTGDGSFYFINQKNPSDIELYTPPAISTTPIGTNNQISDNNFSSIASSVGQFRTGQVAPGGWLSTVGNGMITGLGGDFEFSGLDIDGQIGDSITAPTGGTITAFKKDKNGNLALEMTTQDGVKLRLNHLSDVPEWIKESLNQGIPVPVGAFEEIAKMGNTGFVIPGAGGDGSHLDITGKVGGQFMSMPELTEYLSSGTMPGEEIAGAVGGFGDLDQTIVRERFGDFINFSKLDVASKGLLNDSLEQKLARGNPADFVDFAQNLYRRGLGGAEKEKFDTRELIVESLKELDLLMDQFEAAEGDLGVFKGNIDNIKQDVLGLPTDQVDLATRMANLMDIVARSRTGAALTESEEEFYGKMFPNETSSLGLNRQLIKTNTSIFEQSTKGLMEFEIKRQLGEDVFNTLFPDSVFQHRNQQDISNQRLDQDAFRGASVDTGVSPMSHHLDFLNSEMVQYQEINNNLAP